MIFHYIPYHNHIPYIIVVSHDYPMTMPAHLDIMAPISGHVFAHRHLWSRTLLESTTLKASLRCAEHFGPVCHGDCRVLFPQPSRLSTANRSGATSRPAGGCVLCCWLVSSIFGYTSERNPYSQNDRFHVRSFWLFLFCLIGN